ncbi:hypothetical protein Tco_0180220 [Tanacetum coccineum]
MLELLEDCRQKEIYYMHNDVEDLIESALNSKLLSIKTKSQRLIQEQQEVKNIAEPEAKRRTRITSCLQNFKVIHKESIIPLNNTPQISPLNAITPVSPTVELDDSLSMGDEHLSTISETKSDKLIKSSVENLVPIPSEYEDISDGECDLPLRNDSPESNFTTFDNLLFDCNDDFTSSDDKSLSNEDIRIISMPNLFFFESLLNRDTLIDSSPKFDYLLEEFSGELAHIDPILPGIEEANFEPEEEIHLAENLSYDNSSPRPPEELNAEIADTIVESLSPSPIPVEDSDSHMEEIYLFLAFDDLMPPGIENEDYDSKGDIRFLEELLSNDPLPLPNNESSNFDHHDDPSFPRPPPKPPDVEVFFNFETDTGILTTKVVKEEVDTFLVSEDSIPPGIESDFDSEGDIIFLNDLLNDDPIPEYERFTFDIEPDAPVINNFDELNEDKCFDPGGGEIVFSPNVEDDDSFTFFIRNFLPFLTYPKDSPLLLSTGSEDTIFDPGIST